MTNTVRIDKWLWSIRVFKTRSQATEACKKGRIIIEGITVKPSRFIKINEVVTVRKPPVVYTFRVKNTLNNRVSAKLAVDFYENLTPEEELLKLEVNLNTGIEWRKRGEGRPTKRERRIIDKLKDPE